MKNADAQFIGRIPKDCRDKFKDADKSANYKYQMAKNSNNLKKMRENLLVSKAELARKAGISPLTIDRIEKGYECRVDTKRKIIQALGLRLSEKTKVFKD